MTALLLVLAGCSTAPYRGADGPPRGVPAGQGRATAPSLEQVYALGVARDLLGAPYRSGGDSPAGFDCGGLVQYSFSSVGIRLPRSSREQHAATRPVSRSALAPGDLVFFRIGRSVSHVGIYAGGSVFIHSPSSGGVVMRSRLDEPYWERHWAGAGRVQLR